MTNTKRQLDPAHVGSLAWYGYTSVEEVKNLRLLTPEARQFMEENGWDFEQDREKPRHSDEPNPKEQ
jgi:hypothetical protein